MLIGSTIQVVQSTNKSLNNLCGRVVDETKATITITTKKGEKKIMKNAVTLIINGLTIKGEQLIGRIDERLSPKKQKR